MYLLLLSVTCRYKSFSTLDGKESIWKELDISHWVQSARHCFLSALNIVDSFHDQEWVCCGGVTPRLILKCYYHTYDAENQKVIYITEAISDDIASCLLRPVMMRSAFRPVGVVNISVLRKWIACLLNALYYLHEKADQAPIVHGHIQYPALLPYPVDVTTSSL